MSPTFVAVPMTAISAGAMTPHKWMVGMTAVSPGAMSSTGYQLLSQELFSQA
jgi:hypothetical protein